MMKEVRVSEDEHEVEATATANSVETSPLLSRPAHFWRHYLDENYDDYNAFMRTGKRVVSAANNIHKRSL